MKPTDHSRRGKCDILAARVRLTAAAEIRVVAQDFEGRCFMHLRQYVLDDSDAFIPTSKGVTLPVERVADALDAVRELRDAGTEIGTAATIEKNSHEEVRFSVASWQGKIKADIRTYYRSGDSDDLKPGKGLRFNLGLLPDLERGLEALDRALGD